MDPAQVHQVRRFNRTVTQRIGALSDQFLSRDRPLGQSRLLWEIGPDGCSVRELRARLDLDAGYVTRLLQSLEAAGLVTVGPSDQDGRVRTARLTGDGLAERVLLDRRSDELAESILAPLRGRQRERLVAAMADVKGLLDASAVEIAVTDPETPGAQYCLTEYFAELNRRFDTGFDPERSISAGIDELMEPAGLLLVATLHGEPVGCGALKLHGTSPAEVKRMWISPSVRGLGVGRRLLAELEHAAADHGASAVRLETNRSLTEAIALYRSAGYREVAAFNDEPYADHWFDKSLPRPE